MKNLFKITDDGKLKTSELLKKCEEKFPVYCYWSDVDKNFPPPKKKTTRYFKKNIEADEENANKSADDCAKEGIEGISLRERLIMELQYFEETGEHLDQDNITLCTGSRDSDGRVPCVYWYRVDRELCVYSYDPGYRYAYLRARQAVSLDTSPLEPSTLNHSVLCPHCNKEIKLII